MTTTVADLKIPALYASLPALRKVHVQLVTAVRRARGPQALEELLRDFLRAAAETGCVLHDDDEREVAQRVIDYWVTTFIREDWEPPVETLADFDLTRAPELPEGACPYVGLAAFDEGDAERFFGREGEVAELVRRRMEDGRRLLAVIGPSGSGKSSLVQAGVLPALRKAVDRAAAREGDAANAGLGAELRVHRMVPTKRPLQALATTMGSRQPDTDALAFANSSEQAVHLARVEAGHTLLIVDQLEELFTLCPAVEQQRAFASALLDMSRDQQANTTVLFTLRSDFEERLAALPDLHSAAREGTLRLPPLSAAELRAAVERPANAVGLKFEAGVVEQLVDEVQGEFAALPLLQFTLRALWQRRTRNLIPMRAFTETGGARRALEKAAEAVFSALIPEEQQCARRIFARLVQSSASFEFTRRRALRSELRSLEDPSRVDRVVDRFIAARLLSSRPIQRDAVVEITHEALVRNWPRLVGWLEDNRHVLRQHAQLQVALAAWREGGEHDHDLLSPGRVAAFAELSDLDGDEKDFLARSQALWKAQRKAKARRTQLAMVGLVVAAGVSGLGWWQAHEARDVAEQHSSKLANQKAASDKNAADAVAARKEAARERDLAREQERQALKAKAEADAQRKKADELAKQLRQSNQLVERDLASANDQQFDNLELLVAMVERGLPAVPVVRHTDSTSLIFGRFADAQRDVAQVRYAAERADKRIALFEGLLNRKGRRVFDAKSASASQKARYHRLRVLRLRVKLLKRRVKWVLTQLKSRGQQLANSRTRIQQLRERARERRASLQRSVEIRRELAPTLRPLRKLAQSKAPEWQRTLMRETLTQAKPYAAGDDRALAIDASCGLWRSGKDRPGVSACYLRAERNAATASLRRLLKLRRMWNDYRHAMTLKGEPRRRLLKRIASVAAALGPTEPGAVRLMQRIHAERMREDDLDLRQRMKTAK